ncbi:MAG: Fic family protein [Candidatus Nanohaloarchaea archaeon]
MDAESFDGRGRVDVSKGYPFYVPGSLPRSFEELDLSEETLYYLAEAESSLGDLSGTGRNLLNPQLLISPYMKREAVLSSKIEGTKASLTDLYQFEIDEDSGEAAEDVQEVKNYSRALEYGEERIKQGETIDLDLIKKLHEILMDDVAPERGANINAGIFRTIQNWIDGTNPDNARYVPPHPERVEGLMRNIEHFIQDPPKMSELVNIGLIHYQFESIHPFVDGNGRIGRLLIVLYLMERGKLSQPLLYLSAYFNKHRQEYYDHLLRVSQEADFDSWLRFFLKGIKEQAEDALERAKKIDDLKDDYTSRMREKERSDSFLRGIEFIFQKPVFTINDMAEEAEEMSYSTANRVVKQLVQDGIISQVGDRERNKRYKCQELLDILEEEDMSFDEEETRQISLTQSPEEQTSL